MTGERQGIPRRVGCSFSEGDLRPMVLGTRRGVEQRSSGPGRACRSLLRGGNASPRPRSGGAPGQRIGGALFRRGRLSPGGEPRPDTSCPNRRNASLRRRRRSSAYFRLDAAPHFTSLRQRSRGTPLYWPLALHFELSRRWSSTRRPWVESRVSARFLDEKCCISRRLLPLDRAPRPGRDRLSLDGTSLRIKVRHLTVDGAALI